MAIRDTRFGGNLERANTGIRSLPQRDTISYADRESYGRGQIYNPQMGARDVSGYMEDDDYYNPNVFSRQMAVEGFPNAPREIANVSNFGEPFSSAANLRESINYLNAIKNNPDLIDPMYRDLDYYEDFFNRDLSMADLYKSKEEQMEDAGPFEAMQMERYARENPFLKMLGGTQTTDVTDPRGNVTTTEEMVDPGVYAMSPAELSYMYGARNANPYRGPSDRQPGLNNPFMPSDRQPGLNNPFMPSDRQPGISDINDPLQYLPSDRQPGIDEFNNRPFTNPNFSLTPENIGMDRGPEEILQGEDSSMLEKLAPFLPLMPAMPYLSKGMAKKALDLFSQDDIYQDPIMDMANMEQPTAEIANLETEDILRIMGQYNVGPEEARRIYDETMYGYERA